MFGSPYLVKGIAWKRRGMQISSVPRRRKEEKLLVQVVQYRKRIGPQKRRLSTHNRVEIEHRLTDCASSVMPTRTKLIS